MAIDIVSLVVWFQGAYKADIVKHGGKVADAVISRIKRVCSYISLKCFGITIYQCTIVESSFPNLSIEALLLMFVFTEIFWLGALFRRYLLNCRASSC